MALYFSAFSRNDVDDVLYREGVKSSPDITRNRPLTGNMVALDRLVIIPVNRLNKNGLD